MNFISKKTIAYLLCSSLIASIISGCTSADKSDLISKEEANNNASDKITLRLLVDNAQQLDGLKAVAEEVEKRYNIATEFDLRPGGTEGANILKTRIAVGDMDDLCIYNSGSLLKELNPEVNFIDLSEEPFMKNVNESFKKCTTVNGKVYGVPYGSFTSGAWLYNKKIYKQLGLTVPKTWGELMSNCDKIKAAGITAVIGSYKESWTSQIILLSDFYNLNSQAPSFVEDYWEGRAKFSNTPEAVRGFEKTREVHEKGYMNKDFLSTNYDTALKMLAEGSGVHYPMLTSAISNLAANYPDKIDDIGIFAQPSDDKDINGLTVWPCGSVYIYKGGKNIDAAKKWASFLASEEGVAAYSSKLKPEGPYGVNGIKLPEDISAPIKDELAYFESNSYTFALEFVSPIKGPNLPQICVEAGSGIKSPLECAKEYDKDVEKQAKQLGLYGW